ncbi:hypothetical protein SAY86_001136 [Trapa natans]|uniref:Uncharacterized protein n=1 Tax=Trapa natans TaxID=22666 RepID=A0AAN7M517_TRANT|nr:hypothetical protein SAY86_001136 [Trapa natans]
MTSPNHGPNFFISLETKVTISSKFPSIAVDALVYTPLQIHLKPQSPSAQLRLCSSDSMRFPFSDCMYLRVPTFPRIIYGVEEVYRGRW